MSDQNKSLGQMLLSEGHYPGWANSSAERGDGDREGPCSAVWDNRRASCCPLCDTSDLLSCKLVAERGSPTLSQEISLLPSTH